jgi:hypothetical protein
MDNKTTEPLPGVCREKGLSYWLEEEKGKVWLFFGGSTDRSVHPSTGIPVSDLLEIWSGYEKVINRRFAAWKESMIRSS